MALLTVKDMDGRTLLTREIAPEEADAYYTAWMDAATVEFNGVAYRLHSLARSRPQRDLVLCVSRADAHRETPTT